MNQPHQILNMIRMINQLSQLGRKTAEVVHLDHGEISDGDLVDREVVSSVQDTGIDIKETSYKRVLDCGHVGQANSIAGECDLCSRLTCPDCLFVCQNCRRAICRYCSRVFVDEGVEEIYCTSCYADTKAKRAAISASKAIYGFFVKK